MLDCFTFDASDARPVRCLPASAYQSWLAEQSERVRAWLGGSGFQAKAGRSTLLPGADGTPEAACLIISDPVEPWDFAGLRGRLPAGIWRIEPEGPSIDLEQAALGWALASYRFERYKKREAKDVRLVVAEDAATRRADAIAAAVHLARDLINTPALDLGPAELAEAAERVAGRFDAEFDAIVGEDLLTRNFPAIWTVGQASPRAPRLIDLRWGDPTAPQVTLIGKGVCFDTGGLDLKTAGNMALMKKDMGGAAVTLGLAQAVMALGLPVRMRLLIGAVENSVSGSSYRPGDVLKTRKGLSVEIGNTDAEGRVVLCDLLAEADAEAPALLIDCATLTGAARVALGPDLPALFTPDDALAETLLAAGRRVSDPLWRLPLFAPYRELIDSPVADINNAGSGRFAGAITAALFLDTFVEKTKAWAHLDLFAWNQSDRPGRPKGGEATAMRALLAAIEDRFGR